MKSFLVEAACIVVMIQVKMLLSRKGAIWMFYTAFILVGSVIIIYLTVLMSEQVKYVHYSDAVVSGVNWHVYHSPKHNDRSGIAKSAVYQTSLHTEKLQNSEEKSVSFSQIFFPTVTTKANIASIDKQITPAITGGQQEGFIPTRDFNPKRAIVPTTSGYILAVNYYEQQSMGSRNLFQLQCLAKYFNLAVIKPVMKDSFLRTPLDDIRQNKYLKLEDFFNLEEWNTLTMKDAYAPLVEWQTFISEAPRDVILVQFNHPSLHVLSQRRRSGLVTHGSQGMQYKSGCSTKWPTASDLSFIKQKRFQVVRKVCFNFYYGDRLTLNQFREHLLGSYSNHNVSIIMDNWRGLGSAQRVLIRDTCVKTHRIQEYIHPSQRLVRDANKYINTHMKGTPFLAVMGRFEMSLLTVRTKTSTISYCLQETISELQVFKNESGLSEIFLSVDIGRYGSKKWRTRMDKELVREFEDFVSSMYGNQVSPRIWESSFVTISKNKDAGYIGLLQKVIATRARCILFVGGGAFQRHALHLYHQLNPDKKKQCVRIVKSCTSSSKLSL